MFRSLLSLAAIIAVLAATLVLPTEIQARRCPVEIPETLLSLYKASDVIVIATFDRSEKGEVERQTDDYSVLKTKSYYSVSSTLKGEQQKLVTLEDQQYIYKIEESSTEAETVPVASEDGPTDVADEIQLSEEDQSEAMPGDTVLMFLEKGEIDEEKGGAKANLEPVGYRDGIKKMSGDVLRTYEHRINQLNVIFNSAGNRDAAIVNWLIDVTEDPITRWEGAFELLQGFQELEWAETEAKREAEAEAAETSEESEAAETSGEASEIEEVSEVEEDNASMDRQRYARLITDGHKQALLNILLSSVPVETDGEKPAVASRGDQVLMQLVKNWGDARLAGFLLDQLRAGAGDAYYKYQLMETIAASLNDKKLVAVAEEYGDRLYEEDDTVIEDEVSEEGDIAVEEPATQDPASGETVESPGADNETAIEDNDEAKPQTFGKRRAELLTKFIASADQRIATGA